VRFCLCRPTVHRVTRLPSRVRRHASDTSVADPGHPTIRALPLMRYLWPMSRQGSTVRRSEGSRGDYAERLRSGLSWYLGLGALQKDSSRHNPACHLPSLGRVQPGHAMCHSVSVVPMQLSHIRFPDTGNSIRFLSASYTAGAPMLTGSCSGFSFSSYAYT